MREREPSSSPAFSPAPCPCAPAGQGQETPVCSSPWIPRPHPPVEGERRQLCSLWLPACPGAELEVITLMLWKPSGIAQRDTWAGLSGRNQLKGKIRNRQARHGGEGGCRGLVALGSPLRLMGQREADPAPTRTGPPGRRWNRFRILGLFALSVLFHAA